MQGEARRLQRLLDELAKRTTPPASGSFADRAGRLPWPVARRLLNRYGTTRTGSLPWAGWMIAAREGDPVHAIHGGTVAFADYLRGHGFEIDIAPNLADGRRRLKTEAPDALVLDLMLPDGDGLDFTRELRADRRTRRLPLLMLTARGEPTDRIVGLEIGADDYLGKPFDTNELIARVRALLRRAAGWSKPSLECGPVKLDLSAQTVTVGGSAVDLTSYEYKVLEYLMMHAGELVSKADLTEHIYQQDFDRDSNTVEVFIARLRKGDAFTFGGKRLEETSTGAFDEVMRVNARGPLLMSRAVIRHLLQRPAQPPEHYSSNYAERNAR